MKWMDKNHPNYPENLSILTGKDTPQTLHAIGDLSILNNTLSALFCSIRCPADLILKTYNLSRKLRDSGSIFIGGFHSPIEKDCLDILLRGAQPIIICPGKAIDKMRIPKNWKPLIDNSKLLLLSSFIPQQKNITIGHAQYRNYFASALASNIYIPHAAPNSKTMTLFKKLLSWKKPVHTFDHPENQEMIAMGAVKIL